MWRKFKCIALGEWKGFPRVKNLLANADSQEMRIWSLGREDPLEKGMATHSVVLPGEFHGQRSLMGYSSWGCQELYMTEQLSVHMHTYAHIDEWKDYMTFWKRQNYGDSKMVSGCLGWVWEARDKWGTSAFGGSEHYDTVMMGACHTICWSKSV